MRRVLDAFKDAVNPCNVALRAAEGSVLGSWIFTTRFLSTVWVAQVEPQARLEPNLLLLTSVALGTRRTVIRSGPPASDSADVTPI